MQSNVGEQIHLFISSRTITKKEPVKRYTSISKIAFKDTNDLEKMANMDFSFLAISTFRPQF